MSTPPGAGRQIATLLTGTTLVQAFGLLLSPMVARLYGPTALGQVTAAGVVAAFVATLAPLAMDAAIVLVDTDAEASELSGFVITSAAVVSLALPPVLWALATAAGDALPSLQFLKADALFWSVFVGATAFLTCATSALTSLAVRHQQFVIVSSSRVAQSLTTQGLTLGLGALHAGAMGAGVALVAGQLLSTTMVFLSLRRKGDAQRPTAPSWARIRALLSSHRRFPIYTYPHALLDSLRENALIGAVAAAGGSLGLGHWALVSRTVRGPSALLGSAFSQVFTARASAGAREHRPLTPIMRWVLVRLGLAALAGVLFLAGVGPLAFRLVFGAEWERAGEVARLMMPWIAISLVGSPFAYLAYLLKLNRAYLAWAIVYDCALIAVCTLAPRWFGFEGTLASISLVGTTLMAGILAWQFNAGRRFDLDLAARKEQAT